MRELRTTEYQAQFNEGLMLLSVRASNDGDLARVYLVGTREV